ncbi:hypothetical protein ACHQM5_012738 [Ranunculus cassubicifolius]
MKYARRSVSDTGMAMGKYQSFAQTLQQSRGFGSEFRFADSSVAGTTASNNLFASTTAGADDDDLYS